MLPISVYLPQIAQASSSIDILQLKLAYRKRLHKILKTGNLPYIDIESSCRSNALDIKLLAKNMDRYNIGLMAMSADLGKGQVKKGIRYDNLSENLHAKFPEYFIPVGNGGQPPALTDVADEFLDAQAKAAKNKQIILFGEYEFRHYPSPRQVKQGKTDRDVNIAIDGDVGHRVFGLSEKSGLPIQIHYEVEDDLLPSLESMLSQYPQAKVIWCHLAQVRYIERASNYNPAYVDDLLNRFSNLYFDTAFGDANSEYPLSQQKHARIWTTSGDIKPEWLEVIRNHPQSFLSALDLGNDRVDRIAEYDHKHRTFLGKLPEDLRHLVAYENTWRLLFGEDFV